MDTRHAGRVRARHADRARLHRRRARADRDAPSPQAACDAIRPAFAELLADPAWLPERYQEGDPESGMGGGIGQWLLFRAGDRSLTLFALVVPLGLADARPRPPRLGARRPLPRHPGRGDLRGRPDRAARAPGAGAGRLLRAAAARRRHPPRAHDLARDLGLDPPAHQRHGLRLAACLRRRLRRGHAVPLRLRERALRRPVRGCHLPRSGVPFANANAPPRLAGLPARGALLPG